MSIDRINELIALPWPGVAGTLADTANASVNCVVQDDWKAHIHDSYNAGLLRVEYDVRMEIDAGEFTSSILSPPGYESISPLHVRAAAPLHGTWSAGVAAGFTSHFRAWIEGHKVLDTDPSLLQSLDVYGMRATADVMLDVSEPARPRLHEVQAMLRAGLGLHGPITVDMAPQTLGVELLPPDTLRALIPLDVTTPVPMSPGLPWPKAGFVGFLELTLSPKLEVGYDGDFKIILFDGHFLGQHVKIEVSVPFKFRIDLGIKGLSLAHLLSAANVPRDWGEHPPPILQQGSDPPPNFDFHAPALEVEEAVLPAAAMHAPDDESHGPCHAPYGLIYELQYFCTGPTVYPMYPGPPHESQFHFASTTPRLETYNDTAIWTGHFLAAESFRHAVEPSAETLARVRFILRGIEILFAVTGEPGLPARAARRSQSQFDTDPPMCKFVATEGTPCKPGRLEEYYHASIDGVDWCGFGRGAYPPSRDSYTGLIWGMACAYKLVDDPQVRKTIFGLVTAMLHNLVFEGRWNVKTPHEQPIKTTFLHAFSLQLAALRLGKTVQSPAAVDAYNHFSSASEQCWVPEWGATWDPITKYYGLNLTHGVFATLLLLEDDPKLRLNYKFAFAMIRRTVRHHRNAYFNMVRVITELPAERAAALAEPSGFAPHLTLAQETRLLLQEWLVRRHCTPGPRGLPVEVCPDPQFLLGMLDPHAPNRAVSYTAVGSMHSNGDLAAKFALPVQKRPGTDFIWQQSPFATHLVKCGDTALVKAGKPGLEAPGIDYLLPFWIARYLGAVQ